MNDRQPELRLALAMRGGVSLAVWMGGACAEIDALRRAGRPPAEGGDDPATAFWRVVLEESPYSRAIVDVIAGASAGGLNGVVFGAAIRHGFAMSELLDVWRKVAGVDVLRRRGKPWRALFDGDSRFLDEIDSQLRELTRSAPAAPGSPVPAIDLQLTATLVEPVSQPATSPSDEALRRHRSAARFHFRHDPDAAFPRTDLEVGGLARLAVAARSSASFPFAFEAATVRSTRAPRFDVGPPDPTGRRDAGRRRFADCRGIFSESRGGAEGRPADLHDDDFVVADGGILDNIPIARALEAIRRMPASGPTRRVLVYLHPTGPALAGARPNGKARSPQDRRGARALLSGLVASRLQGESIDEDLEQLEEANRNLRLRRQARRAAAALADDAGDPVEAAREQVDAYREQRAVVDADAVRALLRDPLPVLGEDPFPEAPDGNDDRWRAPLARWSAAHRLELDGVLRETFRGRLQDRTDLAPLMTGGLGPIGRTVELLRELALTIEAVTDDDALRGEVGVAKAELYRLGSLVGELDRIRRIGWVTVAGRLIDPADPEASTVAEWVARSLDDLNALLACDRSEACALSADPSTVSSEELDAARTTLIGRCNRGLQRLATPGSHPPVEAPDDPVDIRHQILHELARLAEGLVRMWPAADPAPPITDLDAPLADRLIGARFVHRVLAGTGTGTGASDGDGDGDGDGDEMVERFAALEVLLVREHLLGATTGVEVSFVRMSAAAPTIDARRFARLHAAPARLDGERTDDHHLLPEVKLAGNELSNFAAFIDERWRTNDWYWGRVDAVPTLVDLLLGAEGPVAEDPARRALVRRRQDQIFESMAEADGAAVAAGVPVDEALSSWQVGLETLTVPGSRSTRRSMGRLGRVGAVVLGEAVGRPRLAWVLQHPAGWVARRAARPRGGTAG